MGSASEVAPPARVAACAHAVLEVALSRPPTLGGARLICIDGAAGAGKTTLADAVARLIDAAIVHMDDLYEGWSGLLAGIEQVRPVLAELAEGRPGHFRRFDWVEDDYGEAVTVAPADLLIVEGVGSGVTAYDQWRTALVWVSAPADVRMHRALLRGGVGVPEHWEQWTRDEEALFEAEHTLARADLVVDASE